VLRTIVVRVHQGALPKRCVLATPGERFTEGAVQGGLPQCWIHAKVLRCKELSDSIFGIVSSLALRQSARSLAAPLSPEGDMVSFCHEPGNLVGCLRRRTGC
jgi:hypothetical protein